MKALNPYRLEPRGRAPVGPNQVVIDAGSAKSAGFKVDARSDFLHVASDPREQAFFDMKGAPDDKFAVRFVKP